MAHLLAQDYIKNFFVSEQIYDQYFKFAIVRNPWSSLFFYNFLHLKGLNLINFLSIDFIRTIFAQKSTLGLFVPADYLVDHNDNLIVDYVEGLSLLMIILIISSANLTFQMFFYQKNISKPKKIFGFLPLNFLLKKICLYRTLRYIMITLLNWFPGSMKRLRNVWLFFSLRFTSS